MGFNYVTFGLLTSDVVGFTTSQRTAIEMQATISIVSEGSLQYKNLRYPRFKNFYGYAQLMSGAYVVQEVALNYLNQELCHWQESSPAINQSIGCATKKILLALTPPSDAEVTVGLLRQRLTSIRFRLLPEVQANIGLNWHVLDPLCEDEIVQPPADQGEPIPPNNANSDPGSRPGNQGGDKADESDNDGDYDPTDGNPPPPVPGGGTNFACWNVYYTGTRNPPSCERYSGGRPLFEATDPTIKPIFVKTRKNSQCESDDGNLMYGGAVLSNPEGIVDIGFWYG